MLAGDFEPSFAVSGAAKDADLIVAAGRGAGVELAVVEAARDHLARALAAGARRPGPVGDLPGALIPGLPAGFMTERRRVSRVQQQPENGGDGGGHEQ